MIYRNSKAFFVEEFYPTLLFYVDKCYNIKSRFYKSSDDGV
jgi:hypothetical protein